MRSALEDADFNSLGLPQSPAHALFAIFDGHAGVRAANFAAQNIASAVGDRLAGAVAHADSDGDATLRSALNDAFTDLDDKILESSELLME